jgi:carbonic anhydrase/acetyltransferase-like protein (isoleucine patch superfamily)
MLFSYKGKNPRIGKEVFIAPAAILIGDVEIDDFSSVWFGAVVRGDIHYIRIGKYTNIQDNVVIHVTKDKFPVEIGDYVTIGHNAIIHGAKIRNNVLIGMGAKILDGADIGDNCIVAAGSVVRESFKVPSNSLVAGIPGKIKRNLKKSEIETLKKHAKNYSEYARECQEELEVKKIRR